MSTKGGGAKSERGKAVDLAAECDYDNLPTHRKLYAQLSASSSAIATSRAETPTASSIRKSKVGVVICFRKNIQLILQRKKQPVFGTRFAALSTDSPIGATMHYLYGSKKGVERRLVGTFSSEPQLRSYVRWATLEATGERTGKFEQGSVLAGYNSWEASDHPLTDEDASAVEHNPTPSML